MQRQSPGALEEKLGRSVLDQPLDRRTDMVAVNQILSE
jgi:hypothetical protein